MNQILEIGTIDSAYELRKAQVDVLLADTDVPVVNRDPERAISNIGRGKLIWQGPQEKWALYYDLSSLREDERAFLPHIKEFYAYFKAIEFYPEYEDYLINRFLDAIDDKYQKIRLAGIILSDLEGTNDVHVTGSTKIDAKKNIAEAFSKIIDDYWADGDTDEIAGLTHHRFAQTMELAPLDAAQ